MCTAITYKTKDHYFGRTLDMEYSYNETVIITPRNFPFFFRKAGRLGRHYAMIGMAIALDGYPLYYDAVNEKGLGMAGLNFPGNAHFAQEAEGMDNIAPFELIPWILGQCANLKEVRRLLKRLNIVKLDFREDVPAAPLHWMIADRDGSIVVEAVREGLKIYDNLVGVLTNNPPFDMQMFHLSNYMGLCSCPPVNRFSKELDLQPSSRGMGALGLPGDLSSLSRFVRAAFVKLNSVYGDSEAESITQFFHILGSVEQQRGSVLVGDNQYEMTVYTSCCNTDKGIYYYITYENRQITEVDMHQENLEGDYPVIYPLIKEQQIKRMLP